MKKAFFVITVSLVFVSASAQRLNKITLGNNGSSTIISYLVDEAITVNFSTDGKIIEWGLENNTGRGYPERLYEYMGRVEYYDSNENEAYRGKVKYLGRTAFTYYTSNDNEAFKGKVKTMNTI